MSTASPNASLQASLKDVDSKFRDKILSAYLDLKRNFSESRFEAMGLCAGKFSETVLRYLQMRIDGTFIPFGQKIGNFADECRKLISAPSAQATESERVVIPRALVFIYTMRNKRGIGHVGGDVDANAIDGATISRLADWTICELIRIHHGLSLEEAQDIVDSISARQIPQIWEIGGKKRILRDGLSAREKSLLLLYSSRDSAVMVEDLCEWIEYSNLAVFKSKVIRPLHKQRLLEHDTDSDSVVLSPKGATEVEKNLL